MMPPRLGVLVLVLLPLASCDRGGSGPDTISGPDAARLRLFAATAAESAGTWSVTASYHGQSYFEDFYWPAAESPLRVTIAQDVLRLDVPCRHCDAALLITPGVFSLGPLACVRACVGTAEVEARADAVIYNLYGEMSAQLAAKPNVPPRDLTLRSSRGALDLER